MGQGASVDRSFPVVTCIGLFLTWAMSGKEENSKMVTSSCDNIATQDQLSNDHIFICTFIFTNVCCDVEFLFRLRKHNTMLTFFLLLHAYHQDDSDAHTEQNSASIVLRAKHSSTRQPPTQWHPDNNACPEPICCNCCHS